MKQTLEFDGVFYDCSAIVAKQLGTCVSTIHRWGDEGSIPKPLILGKTRYYPRAELIEFLKNR